MLNVIITWKGMGSKMICPLMSRHVSVRIGLWRIDCVKGECAWWNDKYEVCSVPMLATTVIEREDNIYD